jgi:hypothetical protein
MGHAAARRGALIEAASHLDGRDPVLPFHVGTCLAVVLHERGDTAAAASLGEEHEETVRARHWLATVREDPTEVLPGAGSWRASPYRGGSSRAGTYSAR